MFRTRYIFGFQMQIASQQATTMVVALHLPLLDFAKDWVSTTIKFYIFVMRDNSILTRKLCARNKTCLGSFIRAFCKDFPPYYFQLGYCIIDWLVLYDNTYSRTLQVDSPFSSLRLTQVAAFFPNSQLPFLLPMQS